MATKGQLERNIIGWFTVNGAHVPIYQGETKEQAVKRHIDSTVKKNETDKEAQKKVSKKNSEKLNKEQKIKDNLKSNFGLSEKEKSKTVKDIANVRKKYDVSKIAKKVWDEDMGTRKLTSYLQTITKSPDEITALMTAISLEVEKYK